MQSSGCLSQIREVLGTFVASLAPQPQLATPHDQLVWRVSSGHSRHSSKSEPVPPETQYVHQCSLSKYSDPFPGFSFFLFPQSTL